MRTFGLLILTIMLGGTISAQSLAGDWHGTLEISGMKIRLIFHLQEADGSYTATMDSPDQGAKGIPVQSVKWENEELTISMPNLALTYTASLDEAGNTLTGTFQQGPMSAPLELGRTAEEKPTYKRPQEPKAPFPYRAEDVSYDNPKAEGVSLAGTLTLPEGNGPFPAVVLISGSGPQDRNEELLNHKPFLVIADHFTRNGIAVLRFDDRGVGQSTGNFQAANSADFATDVQAGINYLKTREEINSNKIGLVGHSEGGLIGPIVAADNADVAFLVMMAGPGVDGEKILLLQQELMAKAEGSTKKEIAITRKISQRLFKALKTSTDLEKTKAELIPFVKKEYEKFPEEAKAKLGDLDNLAKQQVGMLSSPWFQFFLSYDPAENLQRVSCPVLAINGSKDLQVDAEQNIPVIAANLRKGGNQQVITKILPGLNHLFQHSETGKASEYGSLEETFAPEALELMTEWITKQ